MEDNSARVIGEFQPQVALLLSAIPALLALGPNTDQLIAMGKAMFQAGMRIPGASPVQAHYLAQVQQLAEVLKQSRGV